MKIKNLETKNGRGRVVLEADYEFLSGFKKRVFVSVPNSYRHFISGNYDSFLAAAVIPCMKAKEDIEIMGEVSEEFLHSVNKVMAKLESWDLGLSRISIKASEVKEREPKRINKSDNSALFFSGGVDSFYTYLRNKKEGKTKISHLIFVHGFDIHLEDEKMFTKVFCSIKKIAKSERVELIDIKTNIRDILDKYEGWDYSHGGAMVLISMALSKGFKRIYISGGLEAKRAKERQYGTHPELDYLWSTKELKFIHIGVEATRMQKIHKYVAKSPTALKYLRVCWRGKNGLYNCGVCEKCLRTMLSLYSAGVLHKCETLPPSIDKEMLSNLVVPKNYFRYYIENLNFLRETNPGDLLIPCIEKCLEKSNKPDSVKLQMVRLKEYLGLLDARYFNRRVFYFLSKRGYI